MSATRCAAQLTHTWEMRSLGLVLDAYIKIHRQIELDGANGESRRVSKRASARKRENDCPGKWSQASKQETRQSQRQRERRKPKSEVKAARERNWRRLVASTSVLQEWSGTRATTARWASLEQVNTAQELAKEPRKHYSVTVRATVASV